MSNALKQQLRRLADARAHQAAAGDELRQRRALWEQENAALLADAKSAAEAVTAIEGEVRALALVAFQTSAEKKPAPGVEIKQFKTYTITDRIAAETWARETKLALIPEALDEKALMKIATVTVLPFVVCSETPRVQIATTLNATDYAETEPVPVPAAAAVEEDPFA